MKEEKSSCGRENDLISFLYGELNDLEAKTFQRHLGDCVACNAELAAFSDVRESVVAWRNESLGAIVSPATVTDQLASLPGAAAVNDRAATPSAWSALREFFKLSPLWLKGAVAFASVLFCLFAGLAIARLLDKPPVVVKGPATPTQSPQEINALVEQRVQAELERIRNDAPQQEKNALTADNSSPGNSLKRTARPSEVAASATNQKSRRPLSKTEREQLAADLRLTAGKNDSELDLLDDRINQ